MSVLDAPSLLRRPLTASTRYFQVRPPTGSAVLDTANIQASCDLAAAAGGGVIQLDIGTYLIQAGATGSLGGVRVQDHCRLQGRGMGITTLQVVAGTSSDITGVVRTPSGVANTGVQFADFTIDGNSANVSGTPTIIGVYCGVTPQSTATDLDILFERVEAHHCTGYGFDPHERTTRLRIIACTSHDNGTDGFTLDGCYDFVVQGCISYSNTRHGFNFVTASQNGRVIGCDSYSNGSGGYVAQNGAKQIAWSGCQAKGNTSEGWVLNGVAQTTPQLDTLPGGFHTLTGNVAIGNGTHGYHLVGATGCRLSGNHAQDNSQTTTNSSHHYYLDESGTTYSTMNVLLGNGWSATSGVTNQPKYGIAEKSSNDGPNLVVGNTGAGHVTGDINLLNAVSNTQDAHNGSNGAHPATFAYASDSPAKHGLLEWNYDPAAAGLVSANVSTLASGTVTLVKITPQTGGTVNNIIVNLLAVGATLTSGESFAAIFDSSGNRLGITADQSTVWAGTTGLKTMALTASVTLTAGADYYIAFLSVGTTPPKFACCSSSAQAVNAGLGSTALRFCLNATGQTSMPSTLTLSSNTGSNAITAWVALS